MSGKAAKATIALWISCPFMRRILCDFMLHGGLHEPGQQPRNMVPCTHVLRSNVVASHSLDLFLDMAITLFHHPIMTQSSSTPKAAAPNEVACTIILAQQLLLKQENIPATPVSANAATDIVTSSAIALETEQEQTIVTNMNSETTEETIGLLQNHPPPRPKSKSSSDPNSRQIYARHSRNGQARHHLALAKEFFADLDNDEYDDDSDSDHHDTTASPTRTRISSGSHQTNVMAFNELVCAQRLRNTSSSPDQRQEAKTLSLRI